MHTQYWTVDVGPRQFSELVSIAMHIEKFVSGLRYGRLIRVPTIRHSRKGLD